MNASRYVGRIGGLAVALGVGAALFTGNGIAWAGPASQDSSGSSTSGSQDSDASDSKPVKKTPASPFGRIKTSTRSGSTAASTSPGEGTAGDEGGSRTGRRTLADILGADRSASTRTPQSASGTSGSTSTTTQPKKNRLPSSLTDARLQGSLPASTLSATGANDVVVKTQSTLTSLLKPSVVPQIASTFSTLSPVSIVKDSPVTRSAIVTPQSATANAAQPAHSVANILASAVNRVLSPSAGTTPTTPPVDQPATLVLLAALRRGLSGAAVSLDQPSATTASPTLVLNGYSLVPTSTVDVTGFYGRFTSPPAIASTIQGEQEFKVLDQDGNTVGTFDALVARSNSLVFGGTYQEILVTDSTATEGTPPAGSVIAAINYGPFGTFYSAIPSESGDGTNVVSFKYVTPFGEFPGHAKYDDAAAGLADHSSANRPVQLTDEYYIAPQTPSTVDYNAISGLPPLAVAVQGEQVFNVYKKSTDGGDDVVIGSFVGYVTTTHDRGGASTEAILVTEVLGDPPAGKVGTDPSQIPPVGSVYNVGYLQELSFLYSAIPSSSGDVVTFNISTPLGDIHVPLKWDAAAIPAVESLDVPHKYSFVPASTLEPTGINGIPPREVIIQGDQQFGVYNSAGSQIGSFDAHVSKQYDILGNHSVAILVTNDTTGVAGTATGDVPPVGSQFDFYYFGNSGFALFASAIPSPSGDVKKSFKLVTPLSGKFPA